MGSFFPKPCEGVIAFPKGAGESLDINESRIERAADAPGAMRYEPGGLSATVARERVCALIL